MRPKSERGAVRGGLAQLLEYRLFLGSSKDKLCLIQISGTATSRAIFG